MEIQREDSEHLWCLCPNHDDTNASMCINKTDTGKYPKGFGYCYVCRHTINFSAETVDKMAKKKSICRKKVPVDWDCLVEHFLDNPSRIKEVNKLAKMWKISPPSYYYVGFDGEAIAIPMCNENEEYVGIQRRFSDGSKCCVDGSQLGLFIPDISHEEIVVITEGFSDAAVATHLGYFGIGKPSAGFGDEIVRKYLESIEYKGDIIIVADNDNAGLKSAYTLQHTLGCWKTKVVIPDTDLKDYYLKNGKNTTKALLRM